MRLIPIRSSQICQWKYFITPAVAFLLSSIALCVNYLVKPYQQIVQDNDASLQYPYVPSTVPMWSLYLSAFLTYGIVFVYSGLIKRNWNEVRLAFNAWIGGVSITWFLVITMKIITGRPRPNFFHNPNPNDARVSFPSGHTGFAFTVFCLLSQWILGKFRERNLPVRYNFPVIILSMSPVLVALWVGITRIQNYHHHYSDVVAGALIGFAAARIGYCSHFSNMSDVDVTDADESFP